MDKALADAEAIRVSAAKVKQEREATDEEAAAETERLRLGQAAGVET